MIMLIVLLLLLLSLLSLSSSSLHSPPPPPVASSSSSSMLLQRTWIMMVTQRQQTTTSSFLPQRRHYSSSSSSLSSCFIGPSLSIRCFTTNTRSTTTVVPFSTTTTTSLNGKKQQKQQIQKQRADNNNHQREQHQQQQPSSAAASLPLPSLQQSFYPQNDNDNNNTSVLHVMQSSIATLKMACIDEPEESIYHLLAFAMNLSWETGFQELRLLHSSSSSSLNNNDIDSKHLLQRHILTRNELNVFENFVQRRLQHEPIQYIIGQWDFLNHVYKIEPPLLCPRPETEELVLLALQDLQKIMIQQQQQEQPRRPIRILDVGCGTGCIGISLLAGVLEANTAVATNNPDTDTTTTPPCQLVAIDVEERAIAVSNWNAQCILGNSTSFCYQSILSSAADYNNGDNNDQQYYGFDLIISNPPYIPQADMTTLDKSVFNYESHVALFGGGVDGMNVIRDIVHKLPQWCRLTSDTICWMEVDPTHPQLLQEWLASSSSSSLLGVVEYVQTVKDLQGKDRFVKLRVNKSSTLQGKQ